MGAAPPLKIYTATGDYIGSLWYLHDAACLVGFHGEGATVRLGHRVKDTLWTEGAEEVLASDSYDAAVEIMMARRDAQRAQA